ncbi:unnamed protein product [Brassica rapa subsp. trilocularis]
MVTVLLFGVMTIAQKGISSRYSCALMHKPKNGCNRDICQAECTKERNGTAACIYPECGCFYQRNKNNKCLP